MLCKNEYKLEKIQWEAIRSCLRVHCKFPMLCFIISPNCCYCGVLLLNYNNKWEPLVFAGPVERETAISPSPKTVSCGDSDNVLKDTPQPNSFILKSAHNRDGTL